MLCSTHRRRHACTIDILTNLRLNIYSSYIQPNLTNEIDSPTRQPLQPCKAGWVYRHLRQSSFAKTAENMSLAPDHHPQCHLITRVIIIGQKQQLSYSILHSCISWKRDALSFNRPIASELLLMVPQVMWEAHLILVVYICLT